MLEKLAIYGMQRVERAILAALVTGDPALLVGTHGTAKTALCRHLAKGLGLRFIGYDASKAMFEDLIGFPSPAALTDGRMDYVPTPISIWGKEFVLVDELSRAASSMQNKWLEVIRSRQVMGKPIEGLRHIFAAMNPPSYAGAHPLDEALAGRFALVIRVPEVADMEEADVMAIIANATGDDAPLVRPPEGVPERSPQLSLWAGPADSPGTRETWLADFLDGARRKYSAQEAFFLEPLQVYVAEVSDLLRQKELGPDGRRMAMMFRTLRAYIAVFSAQRNTGTPGREVLGPILGEALPHILPFAALGLEVQDAALAAIHRGAFRAAFNGERAVHLHLHKDPIRALRNLCKHGGEAPGDEVKAAITDILGRPKRRDMPTAAALVAVGGLARAVCAGEVAVSPEDQARTLETYRAMTEICPPASSGFAEATGARHVPGGRPQEGFGSLRMAFKELSEDGDCPDRDDLGRLQCEIQQALDTWATVCGGVTP